HARQRDSDTRWGRKRFWKFDRDVKPSISGAAVQTPLSRIGILTEIERSNLHMTPPRGWPVEPDAQRASNRNSSVFRQISVRSSRSKAIASSDFENAALEGQRTSQIGADKISGGIPGTHPGLFPRPAVLPCAHGRVSHKIGSGALTLRRPLLRNESIDVWMALRPSLNSLLAPGP